MYKYEKLAARIVRSPKNVPKSIDVVMPNLTLWMFQLVRLIWTFRIITENIAIKNLLIFCFFFCFWASHENKTIQLFFSDFRLCIMTISLEKTWIRHTSNDNLDWNPFYPWLNCEIKNTDVFNLTSRGISYQWHMYVENGFICN